MYGASVITALTAQNTRGVVGVDPVAASFVGAQIDAVLSDLDVRAIKTGMLADAAIVEMVAGRLRQAAAAGRWSSIRSWWRRAAMSCWRPTPSRP